MQAHAQECATWPLCRRTPIDEKYVRRILTTTGERALCKHIFYCMSWHPGWRGKGLRARVGQPGQRATVEIRFT